MQQKLGMAEKRRQQVLQLKRVRFSDFEKASSWPFLSFTVSQPVMSGFHAEHNVLHKVERQWKIGTQSIDILVFDSIGTFACVNYADGEIEIARAFISKELRLDRPRYLEVPFNVLKRRQLELPDFDTE